MRTHRRPFKKGQACPICEAGRLQLLRASQEFSYKGHTITIPELERFVCDHCHEDFLDDVAIQAVEPTLRLWRREVDGLLSPEEIRQIRKALNVSQKEMAEIIGGGPKSFAKYESGAVNQSQAMDNLLRLIREHPESYQELVRLRKASHQVEQPPITLFAAIGADQHTGLRRIAFAEKRSIGDVTRQALAEYIQKHTVRGAHAGSRPSSRVGQR